MIAIPCGLPCSFHHGATYGTLSESDGFAIAAQPHRCGEKQRRNYQSHP
jgi:hypothetical protein